MVEHMLFPNLRGTTILLGFFLFRIENNYFVVHSGSRNFKSGPQGFWGIGKMAIYFQGVGEHW